MFVSITENCSNCSESYSWEQYGWVLYFYAAPEPNQAQNSLLNLDINVGHNDYNFMNIKSMKYKKNALQRKLSLTTKNKEPSARTYMQRGPCKAVGI